VVLLFIYLFIYYENRTRSTQEMIKLDVTQSQQTKQKVHSANNDH